MSLQSTGDLQALTLVSLGFLARDMTTSLPRSVKESLQQWVPQALCAQHRKPCKISSCQGIAGL